MIFVQLRADQNMSDEMRREIEEHKSKRQGRKAVLTLKNHLK